MLSFFYENIFIQEKDKSGKETKSLPGQDQSQAEASEQLNIAWRYQNKAYEARKLIQCDNSYS